MSDTVSVERVIPAPADNDPRWSLELAGGAMMDVGCYAVHAQRMLGRLTGMSSAKSHGCPLGSSDTT